MSGAVQKNFNSSFLCQANSTSEYIALDIHLLRLA